MIEIRCYFVITSSPDWSGLSGTASAESGSRLVVSPCLSRCTRQQFCPRSQLGPGWTRCTGVHMLYDWRCLSGLGSSHLCCLEAAGKADSAYSRQRYEAEGQARPQAPDRPLFRAVSKSGALPEPSKRAVQPHGRYGMSGSLPLVHLRSSHPDSFRRLRPLQYTTDHD